MMFFALAVFAVVLFVFAVDLVHRTPAALAGAVLLVIVGSIGQEEAIEAVHWETLGLLVGMMILVGILKESGVFGYLAIKSAQAVGGRPSLVLIYLAAITAVLSAFLDNVTTVLLMFPVTLVIAQILEEDPIPFLIVEVLASNIGGTATLVGDPPNIIIGTVVEELTFMDFIFLQQVTGLNPAIVALAGAAVAMLVCGPEFESGPRRQPRLWATPRSARRTTHPREPRALSPTPPPERRPPSNRPVPGTRPDPLPHRVRHLRYAGRPGAHPAGPDRLSPREGRGARRPYGGAAGADGGRPGSPGSARESR